MTDRPNNGVQRGGIQLPQKLVDKLNEFYLDRLSGNVRINILDGKILGFHAEEIVSIKS